MVRRGIRIARLEKQPSAPDVFIRKTGVSAPPPSAFKVRNQATGQTPAHNTISPTKMGGELIVAQVVTLRTSRGAGISCICGNTLKTNVPPGPSSILNLLRLELLSKIDKNEGFPNDTTSGQ